MDQVAEAVKSAIENGIDILRDAGGIDVMAATFIAQICATIVLILVVRFRFWNIVTNFIAKKSEAMNESLRKKEEALKEAKEIEQSSCELKEATKKEADMIIEEAKAIGKKEADEMIKQAEEEIAYETSKASNEIKKERLEAEKEIRNEIIDVAYCLAEKMVSKDLNKADNEQMVNEFLDKIEEEHARK